MNQFPIPKTSSQTLFKCTQTRRCALKKKKKKEKLLVRLSIKHLAKKKV